MNTKRVTLSMILLLAAGTAWTNNWPMFRHDPAGSGVNQGFGPDSPHVLWTYQAGDIIDWSSPAVVNNIVYFGSSDNNTYALYANNGTKKWNYTTGGKIGSSPAVVGGVVYVGSYDHNVYALNASTGAKIWNYSTGGAVWWSSPTVVDGVVYIGSNDYNVYALNASTGVKLWNYSTGAAVRGSPAVADGIVYFGSNDHNVYALNASTGAKIWNYTTGDAVDSSPAVAYGMVYVSTRSADGNLYALNASTGTKVWNYTVGPSTGSESSPAVYDGIIFVGSEYWGDSFYALNATDGTKIWSFNPGDYVDASPTIVNGTVYFASVNGYVFAFNAQTGVQEWNLSTGNWIDSSPAVVNGVLYFGAQDNKLYAVGKDVYVDDCLPLNFSGVTYHLVNDVSGFSGECFDHQHITDNITLDCGGHSVSASPGTTGFSTAFHDNVTIRSCMFSGGDYGIFIQDSGNVTVQNVYINATGFDISGVVGDIRVLDSNFSNTDYVGLDFSQGTSLNASNLHGSNIYLYVYGGEEVFLTNINLTNGSKIYVPSQPDQLRFNFLSSYVNGRPVYWLKNVQDYVVPADAGFLGVIDSDNVTVSGIDFNAVDFGASPRNVVVIANSSNVVVNSSTFTRSNLGVGDYSSNVTVSGCVFENGSVGLDNSLSDIYNVSVRDSVFSVAFDYGVSDGCMSHGVSITDSNFSLFNAAGAEAVYYCSDSVLNVSGVRISGQGTGIEFDGDPSYAQSVLSGVVDSSSAGSLFRSPARVTDSNFSKVTAYAVVNVSDSYAGALVAGDAFEPGTILSSNVSVDGSGLTGDFVNKSVYSVQSPPSGYPADANTSISKYVNITNNTAFSGTFSFRVHYSDSEVSGVNESSLRCYWYNESSGAWENVSASGVNTAGNYVECNTTHFSVFGVFGSPLAQGSEGGQQSGTVSVVSAPGYGFLEALLLFALAAMLLILRQDNVLS